MESNNATQVVFLGAGNVATHLAKSFADKNIKILQVYNHNLEKAKILAQLINSDYTDEAANINKLADVYILAVSDAAIEDLSSSLSNTLKGKLVVHTSGAISSDVFTRHYERFGIFYPLQTFTIGSKPEWKNIPIFISANKTNDYNILSDLAYSISNTVESITDQQRLILHLSAVFVNNFSNHLFTLADQLLAEHDLNFRFLMPLIEETVNKIKSQKPSEVQTGPAKRGDLITIQKHLEAIKDNKSLQKIYLDISRSINPDLNI